MARDMFDEFMTEGEIRNNVRTYNEKAGSYEFLCYENRYSSDVYEKTPVVLGVKKRIATDFGKFTLVVEEPRCNFYSSDGIMTHPNGQGMCENYKYRSVKNGNPAYCPRSNVYIYMMEKK